MMNLTFVSGLIAPRPRTDWVFCSGHQALFRIGKALRAVQVHRSLIGANKRNQPAILKRALEVLGAGKRSAIGHLELDFLAIAVDDAHVVIQADQDIGHHRGLHGGAAAEKGLFHRLERLLAALF